MGAWCDKDGGCNPSEETNNKDAYWHGHNYSCYTDLPDNGLTVGGRRPNPNPNPNPNPDPDPDPNPNPNP